MRRLILLLIVGDVPKDKAGMGRDGWISLKTLGNEGPDGWTRI